MCRECGKYFCPPFCPEFVCRRSRSEEARERRAEELSDKHIHVTTALLLKDSVMRKGIYADSNDIDRAKASDR